MLAACWLKGNVMASECKIIFKWRNRKMHKFLNRFVRQAGCQYQFDSCQFHQVLVVFSNLVEKGLIAPVYDLICPSD